jgi:enoyl-CoA hydratase/carnithine racemase
MAGFPLWRTLVRDDVLRELTYTNREFSGTEAKDMGFVTHIDFDPHARALELAKVIANKHPQAIRGAKRLCNLIGHASDAELLLAETTEQLKVIRTPNQVEAVMANMEKRQPVFVD